MRKIMILVLALCLVTAAYAQDQEPIVPSFTMLSGDLPASGTLQDEVTAQLFAFNAMLGDTVSVTMSMDSRSTVNPFVVLLGPAGQVMATGQQGSVSAPIDVPGTYFVIATTFEAIDGRSVQAYDQPQRFTISVSGNNPPASATGRYAFFVTPLTYDEPFEEGYSSPAEPVYYFAFQGRSGDDLTISMQAQQATLDPMLFLFDAEGNRIAVNDDAETLQLPSTSDAALEDVTLPGAGWYFIFATDTFFYELPAETEDTETPYEGGDFELLIEAS